MSRREETRRKGSRHKQIEREKERERERDLKGKRRDEKESRESEIDLYGREQAWELAADPRISVEKKCPPPKIKRSAQIRM